MSTGSIDIKQLEHVVTALTTLQLITATKETVFTYMNIYRKAEAIRNLRNILITCGYDYVDGQLIQLFERKEIL